MCTKTGQLSNMFSCLQLVCQATMNGACLSECLYLFHFRIQGGDQPFAPIIVLTCMKKWKH